MKSGEIKWLRPDAKSQVSVIYSDDGKTMKVYLQLFFQLRHDEDVTQKKLRLR
jgi:S-adenosylmethionine synthetase